jgi:hypothetical protein
MNIETYIAVILESHKDVAWLNECYKRVGVEELLPVQEVPHNAFRSKTPSYVGIKLVAFKCFPHFHIISGDSEVIQVDPKYQVTLHATQPILDLFVTSLKEKLHVVKWPYKLMLVEET